MKVSGPGGYMCSKMQRESDRNRQAVHALEQRPRSAESQVVAALEWPINVHIAAWGTVVGNQQRSLRFQGKFTGSW